MSKSPVQSDDRLVGRALPREEVATEEARARVELWDSSLSPQRFLVEEEKLGDLAQIRILNNLERYGICHVRPVGISAPTRELVETVIQMIGAATEWQNEVQGSIKDIRPTLGYSANTGNSQSDLGFHVDGTQMTLQPAVLLFQYATGATFGAHSRFADASRILHDFSYEERNRILKKLSRRDAATFTKGQSHFVGPIFSISQTGALRCRIRFDEVIKVNKTCQKEFEQLKIAFGDPYYSIVFQPRDGDIVLIDNWRVTHARTEVHGTRQRHHRRVWFANLKLEHQPKYYLGIRPLSMELAVQIRRSNT